MNADAEPEDSAEVEVFETLTEELDLIRFFFVLPEPLGLPDGYQHFGCVGDVPGAPYVKGDPEVSVIFHQVESSHGRTSAAFEALTAALNKAEGLPDTGERQDPASLRDAGLTSEFTVAEAVTTSRSPDAIPSQDLEHPSRWLPRADSFTRCLRLVTEVVRAYRHATETPYGLPTYVRAVSPIIAYTAPGTRETAIIDEQPLILTRPTSEWGSAQIIMLDHANLPDPFRGAEYSPEIEERLNYWLSELARGNPLHLFRERFLEARRARDVHGDTAQVIVLANTSCELLLDVVLALLMWEEGVSVADAVPSFEEGKVLRRLKSELTPRLGGNWTTDNGAVGDWFKHTYKIRHRVVHGGYTPTPEQADLAIASTHGLQQFVMDRLVERRTTYKRAAMMTVSEEGLRRRGKWNGQIKRFAQDVAPTEPNWRNSFADYYDHLVQALSP